jgi:uncharacterized membrane protein YdbT with pleckstrin-like domain
VSERFKEWLLRVLRVPPRPQPPAGDAASVLTFRASPRYYKYRIALWGLRQLTALAGLIGGTLFLRMAASIGDVGFFNAWGLLELSAWLVFIAQIPFSFMLVHLDFEMRWYLLSDRSLRIREGILNVREKTLTYANIQNISIRRNPLQRLFGLATVAVRAAGGGSGSGEHGGSATAHTHEATFEGVDNGDQIREILQQRIRQHRDSGLGDPDDVAEVSNAAPALLAAQSVLAEARALRLALTR